MPVDRQNMLFSATMPTEIAKLAGTMLNKPVKVTITPVSSTVEVIEQNVYHVNKANKINLLNHLLKNKEIVSALVFSRTKHGADKIVKHLERAGHKAQAIHGNKSQNARQLALNNFKERKTRVLVATDIAARGIDIDELSHVFNYDLPEVPETYVHRIGRTGRAGLGGSAIAFCDQDEMPLLAGIEKLTLKSIPVVEVHPFPLVPGPVEVARSSGSGPQKSTQPW
jgi:ATP-dependent RNA helicase RhlE